MQPFQKYGQIGFCAALLACAAPAPLPDELGSRMCEGQGIPSGLKKAERRPPVRIELPGASRGASAKLVVLISIDGLRQDAIGHLTPFLSQLQRLGVSAKRAYTIANSTTLPSHASMVSGVDPARHGLTFNAYRPSRGRIRSPTVFAAAHAARLPTAMFVGKKKLELIAQVGDVDRFEVRGGHCSKVSNSVISYLESVHKGFVFVHFADTDSAGHRYGWMSPEYKIAVRDVDRCARQVEGAIFKASRDAFVLVTSDHGGHDRNHGSGADIDRHIPWIAVGPGISRGLGVDRLVSTRDTAATLLVALGIPSWGSMQGKPVREAFVKKGDSLLSRRQGSRRGL